MGAIAPFSLFFFIKLSIFQNHVSYEFGEILTYDNGYRIRGYIDRAKLPSIYSKTSGFAPSLQELCPNRYIYISITYPAEKSEKIRKITNS